MIGRLIKSELRLDKAKAIFALIKLTLAANPGSPNHNCQILGFGMLNRPSLNELSPLARE